MERGYVKLWRKTLDSGLLKHPVAWQLLGYFMLHAAWKPTRYATRYGLIELAPGQLATGRLKMATDLDTTERKIRTALDLLSKAEIVTIETTKTHSIITLVNWDKYQTEEPVATKPRPTGDQRATTVKEVKEQTPRPKAVAEPRPGKLFTDRFYECHILKHGQKPSPPVWAFKQADRHAKAMGAEELIRRLPNYFSDPWLTAHPMEKFLAAPDTWIQPRKKLDTGESQSSRDRKRTAGL